ncbi:putative nucleoside-diphosphate-sugar epimerase [Zopfochytrium polystomum]|nr:putative nucleoside-diphosphate-sugar epimerase [Zopfochytrium polystomum]
MTSSSSSSSSSHTAAAADSRPRRIIGVTGATGALGGLVVAGLLASAANGNNNNNNAAQPPIALRILARDPTSAKATALADAAAAAGVPLTVVACTYERTPATVAALSGLHALLFVSAGESRDRLAQHDALADAAADAKVPHVVYTSFFGARSDAAFLLARDHHWTEQRLLSRAMTSPMTTTFLRNNLYMDVLPHFAGADGAIRGPAGSGDGGRFAPVSRRDLAAVAVRVLLDPPARHAGRTYNLTGPEDLSLGDVARLLTEAAAAAAAAAQQQQQQQQQQPVKRNFSYVQETMDEARASRRQYGAEDWMVDAWISTYTAIGAGEMAGVTHGVELVTGRKPMSFAQFLAAEGLPPQAS